MPDKPYPSEWMRGVLEIAVLRVLADGPTYGYAIAVGLEQGGFGEVKGGTLYPLLGRLAEAGHVVMQWQAGESGPGRKYYSLTDSGVQALARSAQEWVRFADHVTRFVQAGSPATTQRSSR